VTQHFLSSISFSFLETYVAIPLAVEHYMTISGRVMTRIFFVINSESIATLGFNIEPLAPIHDILATMAYHHYQQCTPYMPLNILLPLRLCVPIKEISSKVNLISRAVSAVIGGRSNVSVILKGVQEGVTPTG
jgi:hypothetical protein